MLPQIHGHLPMFYEQCQMTYCRARQKRKSSEVHMLLKILLPKYSIPCCVTRWDTKLL